MAPEPASAGETARLKGKATLIYILDTDVFSIVGFSDSPEYLRLHARVLELSNEDRIATTVVTYEEQTRRWLAYTAKRRDTTHQIGAYRRLKMHLKTYSNFDVLDFDNAAGLEFDRLKKLKIRVGTPDHKIAAIALSQSALLITRNVKDFQKIPELRVEDWTR